MTRVYRKFRRPIHVGMSLVLALGFVVRPANFEAILIHTHGDGGLHAHVLTVEEVGIQHEEHDRLHGLEHQNSPEQSVHGGIPSEHSEDCDPVVLILGELSAIQSSVRTTAADLHSDSFLAITAYGFCTLTIDSDDAHRGSQWNFCTEPPPSRGFTAILQSKHAILI